MFFQHYLRALSAKNANNLQTTDTIKRNQQYSIRYHCGWPSLGIWGSATHNGLTALPEPFLRACGLHRASRQIKTAFNGIIAKNAYHLQTTDTLKRNQQYSIHYHCGWPYLGIWGSATHYGLSALPEPFLRACGLHRASRQIKTVSKGIIRKECQSFTNHGHDKTPPTVFNPPSLWLTLPRDMGVSHTLWPYSIARAILACLWFAQGLHRNQKSKQQTYSCVLVVCTRLKKKSKQQSRSMMFRVILCIQLYRLTKLVFSTLIKGINSLK